MDYKLVSFSIEGSGSFEPRHICSMAHFCLGIAADDLEGFGFWKPYGALFVCGQVGDALHEHCEMEVQLRKANVGLVPKESVGTGLIIVEEFLPLEFIASPGFFHSMDHLFCSSHVIILMSVTKNRITLHSLDNLLEVVNMLFGPDKIPKLLLIEVTFLTLLDEVRCDNTFGN